MLWFVSNCNGSFLRLQKKTSPSTPNIPVALPISPILASPISMNTAQSNYLSPMLSISSNSVSSQTSQTPSAESMYYTHYTSLNSDKPKQARKICDHFSNVMHDRLYLQNHRLIQPVLHACNTLKAVKFAEQVWDYITIERMCRVRKPTQLLYSKMLQVYASSGDTINAEALFNKWQYEYQIDPKSLQGHLHKPVNEPVIINQILRLITGHGSIEKKTRGYMFYLEAMLELDICPDRNTKDIMDPNNKASTIKHPLNTCEVTMLLMNAKSGNVAEWIMKNWVAVAPGYLSFEAHFMHQLNTRIENDILPEVATMEILRNPRMRLYPQFLNNKLCIEALMRSKSVKILEFLLDHWLFPLIGRMNFVEWDKKYDNKVSNHIKKLDPSGVTYFRLQYLSPSTQLIDLGYNLTRLLDFIQNYK